ncbi:MULTISPECIES: DUF2278 family protein [unclassified Streptomyces]|uniref:DUF2278 family protein n=1 Tax=unclassified Streptomyces TaxID=2593676 RepID=UPI002E30F692|nr:MULTISPECIES: DUF2278 family protein [unclassified Streptomyces]WUC68189.1 DUF2278 family protein [Streptomyces sp. NBC_00539]
MPLKGYGVLAARAVDRRREGSSDTPHYQIHLTDNAGTHYRAAVNVESQQAPSELLYLVDDDLRHPVTELLPPAGSGWTALASRPGTAGLDFIRGNLFDPASMRVLPPDVEGADNDLADLLDHYVQRAIADPTATLYVFGQRFGPEANIPDKVFGFRPGNGVHDIHMNQGNSGRFRSDDGVRQDGAMLVHLPAENRWVGIFLAFQSQSWHTDDNTGHSIDTAPPRSSDRDEPLRIMAALVNPSGSAPEAVTVLNTSPAPVDLRGWQLTDRNRQPLPLPAGTLEPGTTLTVASGNGFRLGDQGGTITLLNPDGIKVHGVAYTARQAEPEGRTITF